MDRDTLQQDLSLDCDGDLHVVLAFAENIRTNTYFDVLGDPQTHSEAVIREFEALLFYECVFILIIMCVDSSQD